MPATHCPKYGTHSCTLIDAQLGWSHGCDPNGTCKKCLSLGGPDSPEAAAFRAEKVVEWVKLVRDNIERFTVSEVAALIRNHMTEDEGKEFFKSPEVQSVLNRPTSWSQVKPSWEMAESFVKSALSKGFNEKRVDLTIKNQRHISCFGKDLNGKAVSLPCPSLALSSDGKTHFCNSCGCGDREVARLDRGRYSKLDYPYLECPRRRPGFSNSLNESDIVFDAKGAGFGDLIASFWLAEGWKAKNRKVSYFVGDDTHKRALVRLFNQVEVLYKPDNAIIMGGAAPYYQYEVAVDKGANNRLDVWSSRLEGNPEPRRPSYHISPNLLKLAEEEIARVGRPFVMLFPFANWNPRQWPLNYWVDLAYTLNHKGVRVAAFSGNDRKADLEGFPAHYSGLDVAFLAALMVKADLVVGNDSGPAWMASSLNVPTIALMGPTSNLFTKSPLTLELSQKNMACTGCHFDGSRGFRAACDKACRSLMMLPHEVVAEEVMKCLESPTYIPTYHKNKHTSSPQQTPVALSMSISNSSKPSSAAPSQSSSLKQGLGRAKALWPLLRLWRRMSGAWSYAWTYTNQLSIKRRNDFILSKAQRVSQHSSAKTHSTSSQATTAPPSTSPSSTPT